MGGVRSNAICGGQLYFAAGLSSRLYSAYTTTLLYCFSLFSTIIHPSMHTSFLRLYSPYFTPHTTNLTTHFLKKLIQFYLLYNYINKSQKTYLKNLCRTNQISHNWCIQYSSQYKLTASPSLHIAVFYSLHHSRSGHTSTAGLPAVPPGRCYKAMVSHPRQLTTEKLIVE